jgi:hypothetical protein
MLQPDGPHVIKHMHSVYWITKATDVASAYVILLIFHGNNGYTNTPQCYVTYAACRFFPISTNFSCKSSETW